MAEGKVLVTGAGGFIGSHLTEALLEAGRAVRALDLNLDRIQHLAVTPNLQALTCDIRDKKAVDKALAGVCTVFHLAAAHLGASTPDTEFQQVNVDAVKNLVSIANRAGVQRFIHCSSVGVFGRIENPPADETTICRPELTYERTKLEGEKSVLEQGKSGELQVVVLRPVWVYGPGCGRTEKLFRAISKGRFVVAGRGRTLRHCIYIRDMVDASLLAETSLAASGEVIIVGDQEATTVRDLVDKIAKITGARPPRSVPLGLLWAAAVTAEAAFLPLGKEPPISRRSLRFFTGNTAFSTERARSLLGFEPRYDLTRGLAETHELLGWAHR
ncbi:MAG: NAD-dependent epimerase/dehydratase family protein [Thermoanaerobaculia bacterium]